jgi:oligopeptidase A
MHNPLLDLSGLPRFSTIRPEHAEPAVERVLADNRTQLDTLLGVSGPVAWSTVAEPLEVMEDRLNRVWSPVRHLNSVADSEAMRSAHNTCLPKLTEYATEVAQNEGLYLAFAALGESPEYGSLDAAQCRVIDNALRDFRLAGVDLAAPDKQRYREIQQELSTLTTRFQDNVMDATQGWTKHITEPQDLAGMPESAMALARQAAAAKDLEGWLLTLEFPSYIAVMTHADSRDLRREVYEAYVTRASDAGPDAGRWDNSEVMERILALRHELARLTGFANFAARSLATKMVKRPQQVLDFLNDLALRSRPRAFRELGDIRSYACGCGLEDLQAWDIPYYSEKLRRERYAVSQEDLKPYFPEPRVLEGLFDLVARLFGISIRERGGVEVWHPDVRFFEITDARGELRGQFYVDLYARANKRGGAWMDDCASRRRTAAGVQTPVAFLVCNLSPPVGGQPALFTHEEVTTLFHEFGHGLHHMLTRVDYAGVSGINGVPWDAVELPSQFMENWCWEREALDLISGHYQTGEPLPQDLFQRMGAARNFQSGMFTLRQLEFALFDFRLHLDVEPHAGARIQQILDEVRSQVAVVKPPAFNRFQHSFSHIFSGGYAAGYYSYKWAEVLAADAFSQFEENGLFDAETGQRFLHTLLEQGGSRDPMELFVEFRGREPTIEALLRHSEMIRDAEVR